MAIKLNAIMTFQDYNIRDDGIDMHFVCLDPGPGQENDYTVFLTDAELASVSTLLQLRTLVTTKLQRKLRASGVATKLDALIGGSITI
jgi:hypothetical protein